MTTQTRTALRTTGGISTTATTATIATITITTIATVVVVRMARVVVRFFDCGPGGILL
jgi:hypothetical protein